LIALATNAAVREPALHLAFENTPGVTERPFFQAFLPNETGIPFNGRHVPTKAVLALVKAIGGHQDQERILRATGQYHAALMNWELGQEIIALAHIYMGIEALTKTYLRKVCQERGMDENQLVSALRSCAKIT
jgi:hypothetical protein